MDSELLAHDAFQPVDPKKQSRLNIFLQLKLDFHPFLLPKCNKYGQRFSLPVSLVGYNKYPRSTLTGKIQDFNGV